jgi:Polyketide cyclase / dehydrase and lipid transport
VDVEKVEGSVLDLERAWREDQDRTAVYVEPGSTRLVFDIDLPASPTIVWDWVNSTPHQRQWQISADSIDMRHPKGVWGVGTTSHCVHGKVAMVHEVVDSKPFAYFTLRSTLPFGQTESTWELTPSPEMEMTHLQIRMRPEQRLRTRLTTRLVWPRMGRMMGRDLANLARLLAVENAVGSSAGATAAQSDPSGPQR